MSALIRRFISQRILWRIVMRTNSRINMITLLVLAVFAVFSNKSVAMAAEPTINKPSIQITLRTQQQYYRNGQVDQETWSWTPRIAYRVVGPISAGSQLSVEFALPSGKPWIRFDCNTKETK